MTRRKPAIIQFARCSRDPQPWQSCRCAAGHVDACVAARVLVQADGSRQRGAIPLWKHSCRAAGGGGGAPHRSLGLHSLHVEVLRHGVGAEERQRGRARADAKLPRHEVQRALVALEVVEAEDELGAAPLVEDRDGGGDEGRADLEGAGVDAADDVGRADSNGDACEALVHQTHDAALLSAGDRHDRRLHAAPAALGRRRIAGPHDVGCCLRCGWLQ